MATTITATPTPTITATPPTTTTTTTIPKTIPKYSEAEDAKFALEEAEKLKLIDPAASKAYILTATGLFPHKLEVHLCAYSSEKEEEQYENCGKIFSYIVSTFQMEQWEELSEMLKVLSAAEAELSREQEFFITMFPYVTYEVQHKLIKQSLEKTENIYLKCKSLMVTFRRFPGISRAHSSYLLELLAEGVSQKHIQCQEMLFEEAFSLFFDNTPTLPQNLVHKLFTIALEYCVHKIVKEDNKKRDVRESWSKIFQILALYGQISGWDAFPTFNRTWSQRAHWDKLLEVIPANPEFSTQVLFHATTLFIYSLHCYIRSCNTRVDDVEVQYVFVEGFSDFAVRSEEAPHVKMPLISFPGVTNEMLTDAFLHAAKCWQLLTADQFQREFNKMLLKLPLKAWIAKFLFDLSMYFGRHEEAEKLMADMGVKSKLIQNVQILSLSMLQDTLTLTGFESILNILAELPAVQGQYIDVSALTDRRRIIFLPLTQRALVQYCCKAIVRSLHHKLFDANCSNQILGDMLILSQLEYPRETAMCERIFALINTRPVFTYRKLINYLVTPDFIEELLFIWNHQQDSIILEITPSAVGSSSSNGGGGGVVQPPSIAAPPSTPRRSSSRSGEKCGDRDNMRSLLKHQILRANENLTTLIANFITQEHSTLQQSLFCTITEQQQLS